MSAAHNDALDLSTASHTLQISPSLHKVTTAQGKIVVVKTLQTHALNAEELQELLEEVKALWMPNRHNNIVRLLAPRSTAKLFFYCSVLCFNPVIMCEPSKCRFWTRIRCCRPPLAA